MANYFVTVTASTMTEGLPGVSGIKGTSPFTLREQGILSINF